MSPYRYRQLSSGHNSIRLLRLMPHEDKTAEVHCELFEYPLNNSSQSHLYEALSYVWGNANKKLPVFLHGHRFDATTNLHAALSQLRNHTLERILWIDAICIDQQNLEEKEHQIQFMATIYARAYRVIVWLGEASDDSDLVFEEIRRSEGKVATSVGENGRLKSAGLMLLQRMWFRRIWILQEVAAARNIVIMCGRQRIDGHAFCLGVDDMINACDAHPALQSRILSVTYLVRGAIFRPDYSLERSSRSTLNISPLSELVDMYHANEATQCHDKVFALLGMSTDDLSKGDLSPNYGLPWAELLQRLVKHVISNEVSVQTCGDIQAAVIRSRGCIVGEVTSVGRDSVRGDRYRVEVQLLEESSQNGHMTKVDFQWTLRATATTVQAGDLICLLRGATKLTIIRLCRDYFKIVMVAVNVLEEIRKGHEIAAWSIPWPLPRLPNRKFLLVWDWETSFRKTMYSKQYETWVHVVDWGSEQSKVELEDHHARATRLWDITLIMGDITYVLGNSLRDLQMQERGREAMKDYDLAIKHKELRDDEKCIVADLLLEHVSLYGYEEARSGRLEPLAWAAEGHHDAVVELLINSMRQLPKDMLSQAVRRGHEVVVRLMLQHGRTNFKLVPMESLLALRFAANAGRAAMVRVLLENGKIDAHSNARNEPLLMAASSGHGAVVELLLDTGIFEVEARDKHRNTPLSLAASRGHEAVVRLLLATSDVDVLNRNIHEDTPLMQAIDGGHDGVVRLLLDTGKCDLDTRNKRGETPLSRAITKAQQAETLSPSLQGSLENEWGALNWPSEREREGLQAIITMLREASEKGPSPDKVLLEPGNVDSYSQEPLPHKPTLLRKIARGRKHMVKLRQLGDM